MPSEFHRLFHGEMESALRALEAKSQRRTLAEIHGVNLCSKDLERSLDAWRAQSHVRGSASATITAAAGCA